MDLDQRTPTKQDLYLAQIAAVVRVGQVGKDAKVKTSDYLLKFEDKAAAEEVSLETRMQNSKNFWLAALAPLGVKLKEKKT